MNIKLRDVLMVSAVLFLGFIAYSNFSNRPQNWYSTNCYEKIQYQLTANGKKGNRFKWIVKFKNNYHQLVTFNYGVTEEENNYLTTHRKTLQAHEVSENIEIYTESDNFYILVDKLSLHISGQPTEPCEEN
ncbi:hypothetical protein SAMN04488096_104189 [Mesonia phycicola]|uniref:Uncharacterized protein n=1 Tax=Mesonia phycicola TaxID=579105 RepID=A0A1M6DVN4_9FLAO|nr:hypothetical protein [Mesonia phycicola]SHI77235.1 hypothetical protein SAMN04488096_104189 [Mesonia phycicola]